MAPPRGLRACVHRLQKDELVVLSYPLDRDHAIEDLSIAEREVVAAVLEGKSNREIARDRGRSHRTVANQLASAFRKLGVASRSELAARASEGSRVLR